jgi:hypothetical protein
LRLSKEKQHKEIGSFSVQEIQDQLHGLKRRKLGKASEEKGIKLGAN